MLLFWMWLLALALLGGAEVNAAIELYTGPASERSPRSSRMAALAVPREPS
jgi:uncharacterized BrkB/YihY/UPF0761 family membrane protein